MPDITRLHGGAVTTTGNGAATIVPRGDTISVGVVASAVSGTTPSATFEIQWSHDGQNWGSADGSPDVFTAITAAKAVAKNVTVKGPLMRLAWTVSGTSPNFTVAAAVTGC